MPARPTEDSRPPPRRRAAPSTLKPVATGDVDAEVSKPTLAAPADDDDATKGEWLFKQDDMVLGPVTAIVLVERIKQGELSADTPIARDGQPFRPMKLVALFREAHEATLEKKRREEEERRYTAAVRRSRILRGLVFAALILVPAAGGGVAGRMVMVQRPWDHTADWIAKAPPLVDLPPKPPEVAKPAAAPPPAVAENDRPSAEEPGKAEPEKHSRFARLDRREREKVKAKEAEKTAEKEKPEKDQGFVKELTNEQAIAPLKNPAVRGALGACFRAELQSNPDMPTPLVLAYTITEAGRSANVELTNRELRGRPVQSCVQHALSLARWPRFEGERKNVTVPFNIKKPKTSSGPVTGHH